MHANAKSHYKLPILDNEYSQLLSSLPINNFYLEISTGKETTEKYLFADSKFDLEVLAGTITSSLYKVAIWDVQTIVTMCSTSQYSFNK